jgi:CRP-like cAMP-binding protein
VRALVVTARSFRRLLDEQPEIKTSVMQAMADRLAPETL